MNNVTHKNLIVLVGPTAVGKTMLAIKIANYFGTDIISADARQFYREMNIGTAKPTIAERLEAKHYFVDNLSITDNYNAGIFESEALHCLEDIFTKSNMAVMAGGSGLFLKAVCEGFDPIPNVDPTIRIELNKQYGQHGIRPLIEKLAQYDKLFFEQVDQCNTQRIIRALEICIGTGRTFSSFRNAHVTKRPFNIIKIGINIKRELLYQKIEERVDNMIQEGLVNEVENLLPYQALNPLRTVGYTEIFDYLNGKSTLIEAISLIKRNTRHYAKRQLTWFNRESEINWFEPSQLDGIILSINQKIKYPNSILQC